MRFESKSEDGTFQTCGKSTDTNVSFMEIYRSITMDEKLHYVIDGVYIGSQDSAVNLPALNECKITHILNVATGIKNAFPEQYKYLSIELLDLPETNIREVFSRTNKFIQQAIADNGRVLVHCNAGISRSSSIVLAYLLAIHRMKYEDAYELLKRARSIIRPNEGFVKQLKEYAAEIAQRNEENAEGEDN
jgi:atypical dual specificity phosphatase